MIAEKQERPRARIERQDTRSYGVQGAMTFESVTELWKQGDAMFTDNTVVQIDLAGVTRTDSAGLALLVEWMREASRQGGRIEFLNLPSQLRALAGAVALLRAILAFNGLVRLRNKVREGFAGVDVQLRRRHDLVPALEPEG